MCFVVASFYFSCAPSFDLLCLMNQVQDYYLALKFNQGSRCVRALYRLCTACCMLHNCRNAGSTRGHPYPKIMLLYMLVLQHWRQSKYCGYAMMKSNMAMFNEELGELTFSILARSVLADHTRDDFEHMDRLFRLLRVYRDVKGDVVADTSGASNSLNWRHKINKVGEEVTTTELFFKRIIRQMVSGTYTSYDGTPKCYTNAANASTLKVRPDSPLVYMQKQDLDAYLLNLMAVIKVDMNTNFLYPYSHIWPECINHDDDHKHDVQVVEMIQVAENQEEEYESDDENHQRNKEVAEDVVEDKENEDNIDSAGDEGDEPELDHDDAHNPSEQPGWEAWGRVHQQHQVVGKRNRNPVVRFNYGGRRRGGHYPEPNM